MFRGRFYQEASSATAQTHLSETEPEIHTNSGVNHVKAFIPKQTSAVEMFPCALTSERCRANFRPQFLAFWSAESKSFPWPTCMIKDMESAARNKWSMMLLQSELTVGSPLRSSPTTIPSLERRKSSASFTVSIATSGPCLRSTATRNLFRHSSMQWVTMKTEGHHLEI